MEAQHSIKVSKAMSLILRHNPGGKVRMDSSGFVDIGELCAALAGLDRFAGHFERTWLDEALGEDRKRFEYSPDGTKVRAVSGHSFHVDLGLQPYHPRGPLFFGTTGQARDKIASNGMSGTKLKVRLLETMEEALAIAESRPGGDPMVVEVDAVRLAEDGWTFGKSAASGEILTDHFGPEYCNFFPAALSPSRR